MAVLMSIPYKFSDASVSNVREINSSFASGTLKVMYLGENRNNVYFSKEAVEQALPSLYNVPIVCHWDADTNKIGAHDMAVVSDENGGLRLKNLTEPCGVVPEHAQFSFQTEEDADGNEHEYLIIDGVLLWKRQDVYHYIVNTLDGRVKHSMEISVNDRSKTSDGLYEIKDFEFLALCLLGEDSEPCFQGSELELFSTQNFKQKMQEMMLEMKNELPKVTPSIEDDIKRNYSINEKGGTQILDEKKMDLLVKYGINDVDKLDFSIEEMSLEELEQRLVELANGNKAEFLLHSEFYNELRRAVESVEFMFNWGKGSRYWIADCDEDKHQVYCFDGADRYLLYGFDYVMDNDSVTIKWDTKKRKKFEIVDFNEGEQVSDESPMSHMFSVMEEKLKGNIELEAKCKTASEKITSMETELNGLRKFKIDTENVAAKTEREDVIAQFSDLSGIEEFESLCRDCMTYDVETLEEKCFAIRGKNGTTPNFSLKKNPTRLKVDKEENLEEPYGGLFVKYAKPKSI